MKHRPARSSRWLRLAAGATLASGVVLGAQPALAHDPPRIYDVLQDDTGSPDVVLMNRGMLFADGAGTYAFMCNEALGINTAERPHLQRGPDGTLSVVTTAGLLQSTDRGCTWSSHPTFEGLALRGFARSEGDDAWYVSTAVNAYDNGVFVSVDGGQSWSRRYTNPSGAVFEHLRVAPSDAQRLYASGLRLGDASFIYFVARSSDAGASFDTYDVPLEPGEFEVRLLGVHPTNPDVVYAVANNSDGAEPLDRFVISQDGGESFSSPAGIQELDAFAVSPDGQSLWIGGKTGLLRSEDGGAHFAQVGETSFISTLWHREDGLRIAGHFPPQRQGLAHSIDGGESAEPVLDFEQATHALSCPSSSMVPMTCESLWTDWVYEQMQRMPALVPDAGATVADAAVTPIDAGSTAMPPTLPDASTAPGSDRSTSRSGDGGCRIASSHSHTGSVMAAVLVALALSRRRRR